MLKSERMGPGGSQPCFHCREVHRSAVAMALPVDMSEPVGRVHAYPRNPVSHTAVAKLLPVLGKFLARGDYEHSEIQNVCVGLGPRYKHGHW